MRILVLTDRFVPEVTAVPARTLAHAREWRRQGHEVTVVTCAPNFPKGKVFDGYKNKWRQIEDMDGIKVIRLWSYMVPNEGRWRRTLDYMSFMVSAIVQHRKFPDYDILVASSPPIFVAIAGAFIAWLRKKPWIFELRDLWPASITAVGVSKSPALRFVEHMELTLYRRATRVMALTQAFKTDLEARGIDPDKIDIVTNGVDTEQFEPRGRDPDVRRALGIPQEAFLAGYVGTVGLAHDLSTLVRAAHRCADDERIRFLVMGEGAERRQVEDLAASLGLKNIVFHDFVPHTQISRYIEALDLSIVHLKRDPLFKTVIPSKIFEHMALGIPILMGVEGESADIVEACGAGRLMTPGDDEAMAHAVRALADDPQARAAMAHEAKLAVRQRFDRRVLAQRALVSFERAVETGAANRGEKQVPVVKAN